MLYMWSEMCPYVINVYWSQSLQLLHLLSYQMYIRMLMGGGHGEICKKGVVACRVKNLKVSIGEK